MKKLSGWISAASVVAIATAGVAYANTGSTGSTADTTNVNQGANTTSTANTAGKLSNGSSTSNQGQGAWGGGPSATSTANKTTTGSSNNGNTGAQVTGKALDDQTRMVIAFLHEKNQQEIKLGNLAKQKAQTQDVKDFADHMVKDHTDADKQISDLASKYSFDMTMPKDVMLDAVKAAGAACYTNLAAKTGNAFEAAYLAPQVDDHELVLSVIQKDIAVAPQDVKTVLTKLQGTIQGHLDMSKKIDDKLLEVKKQQGNAVGGGPINDANSVGNTKGTTSTPSTTTGNAKSNANDNSVNGTKSNSNSPSWDSKGSVRSY